MTFIEINRNTNKFIIDIFHIKDNW